MGAACGGHPYRTATHLAFSSVLDRYGGATQRPGAGPLCVAPVKPLAHAV